MDIYNVFRYGNKNRGKAIFEKWYSEGWISTNSLLLEYAPHAMKKRLEKFENVNVMHPGYVYAPYIPLHTRGVLNGPEEWFEESLNKTMSSRYAKVEVNTNFYGTLFPGETPPQNGSYRRDIKLEHFELERKQINRPVPNVDVIFFRVIV
jgi:hypothetical protein